MYIDIFFVRNIVVKISNVVVVPGIYLIFQRMLGMIYHDISHVKSNKTYNRSSLQMANILSCEVARPETPPSPASKIIQSPVTVIFKNGTTALCHQMLLLTLSFQD